jgi:AraC-like DNA-binding protein
VPQRAVRIIRPGRFAVVTAPVPWFMGCRFGFRLVERVLAGEMVIEPSSDRRGDAGAFMRWQADLASDDAERRDIAQQEIRARLRRMALHIADARPESAESEQAEFECDATLVMARYIAENFREPITVADVADAARMSPDRAARLFSKVWHMSPTAFVARYRLLEAQRLLATSSYKIIEISERSGFGSVSQFYAAFQKAYGCSPRHCRQTLTGAAPLAETSAGRP